MTTAIQAYAAEINERHEQAQHHAGKAIDHAKAAGDALLKAKAQLEHGQFLPWLAANCKVSPRQAQRYMGVAQGKPLPIRAIKNDTVSHLADKRPHGNHFVQVDIMEVIADLREQVKTLEAENDAVRASCDSYMRENVEKKRQVAYWKRRVGAAA